MSFPLRYAWLVLLGIFLAGCAAPPTTLTSTMATPTVTLTPTPELIYPQTPEPGFELTLTPGEIPEPEKALTLLLGGNLRILLLAGQDRNSPFVGRTDALMLVLYDPLQARAGVISLPPDMLVTIPSFGTGKLNTAYALGGAQGLLNTITYNFGVTPDHYAVFDVKSFVEFIDQVGGIYLKMDDPMALRCKTSTPSPRPIKGEEVLCIFKLRSGPEEIARNQRQAVILKTIFNTMVSNGNLVRLPKLADDFSKTVDTDLQFRDLVSYIPLALQMGDVDRFKFYALPAGSLKYKEYGNNPPSTYLVPEPGVYTNLFLKVAKEVTSPMMFTSYLPTLQYALLVSPTPTYTPKPTWTPTRTPTSTRTVTPTRTKTPKPSETSPGP